MTADKPVHLKLRLGSKLLEVRYAEGRVFQLPFEYLRVYSPSAEVRGHSGGEPLLVGGKREVGITAIEPVGQYAVRLRFDDGHDTGLYSWNVLQDLGEQQAVLWPRYLERLEAVGMSRDSDIVKLAALPRKYRPAS